MEGLRGSKNSTWRKEERPGVGLRGPLSGWALPPPFFPPVSIVPVFSDSVAGWGLPWEEVVAEGLGTSPSHP